MNKTIQITEERWEELIDGATPTEAEQKLLDEYTKAAAEISGVEKKAKEFRYQQSRDRIQAAKKSRNKRRNLINSLKRR